MNSPDPVAASPPSLATLAVLGRGLAEPAGGVREYLIELTRALAAAPPSGWQVRAYLSHPDQRRLLPGVESVVVPGRNRLLWDHWLAPRRLRRDRPEVVLCPKGVVPLGLGQPALVTIHDLLYFPLRARGVARGVEKGASPLCGLSPAYREYRPADVAYMRLMMPRSVRRAARVLADSECTRRDALEVFGVAGEKVVVAPLGVSPRFQPLAEGEIEPVLRRLGVERPYVFYAGHLSRRKNVAALVRAMGRLAKRHGEKFPHRLVITGRGRPGEADFAAALAESGLVGSESVASTLTSEATSSRFVCLGLVSAGDLPALYGGADLFVYPSRYEGFGLPLLEAMACGCPVVASTGGSLPEVAGDAALFFAPDDVEALARQIEALATGLAPDLDRREQLIARGLRRAAEFTWRRAARVVWQAAQEASR